MLTEHRRDGLYEFVRTLLRHSFVLDCMAETLPKSWAYIEELINEHMECTKKGHGHKSRLKQLVPTIGTFHTPLMLQAAFEEYDAKYKISTRKFIQPSFNDIRHTMNLAQVNALKGQLKLVTFDGDCTLYSDGNNFAEPKLARNICLLLRRGVTCALVTAAGYGYKAERYEQRIGMLLKAFVEHGLTAEERKRFYVLGGECHYLLQVNEHAKLIPIPELEWVGKECHGWPQEQVTMLLDVCEGCLKEAISDMNLRTTILRKERAVGMIPGGSTGKATAPTGSGSKRSSLRREVLDECVMRVKRAIEESDVTIPYCAFNGGADVFIDVGNKRVGVSALQKYLKVAPSSTLHVGDQFLDTGNDFEARNVATTVWVTNPHETKYLLKQILQKCCGLKRKLSEYTSATLNALIPLSAAGDNGASAAAVGSGSAISPETIPEDIAEKGGGGGGGPAAKRRAP